MLVFSQGGAVGGQYGHLRSGQGSMNPVENAAVEDAAAKVASRADAAATAQKVAAPAGAEASGPRGGSLDTAYASNGSKLGVRSMKVSTVSAMSAFEAAIEKKLEDLPPSNLQQLISAYRGEALERTQHQPQTEKPQTGVEPPGSASAAAEDGAEALQQSEDLALPGPNHGRVGGSGPKGFNSSLSNDGVATLEEVWAKSSWAEQTAAKAQPDRQSGAGGEVSKSGADPIGYDGAHLAPRKVADGYAAALRAAFA